MTITSKGQVTIPKSMLSALKIDKGDRVVAKLAGKKMIVEPAGRGILDFAGKFPKFKIPKSKTLDDLINEAHFHDERKSFR